MILTKNEAKAVYDAMCALNNVGGTVAVTIGDFEREKKVFESDNGVVSVFDMRFYTQIMAREEYDDQDAFAKAYGVE